MYRINLIVKRNFHAEGTKVGSFQIVHTITEDKDGRTQARLLNPTGTDIQVETG